MSLCNISHHFRPFLAGAIKTTNLNVVCEDSGDQDAFLAGADAVCVGVEIDDNIFSKKDWKCLIHGKWTQ